MDNMKCAVAAQPNAAQPKEFANVRDYIEGIEKQQDNVESILDDVLYRLSGMEPKEGEGYNGDFCLPRLETISSRNETILGKLRRISDCI